MSAPLRLTPPDPSALTLHVVPQGAPRQFNIENGPGSLGDFDREYVSFGGYFGPHDPHVFAAAPGLVGALELALRHWSASQQNVPEQRTPKWVGKARAALARARGEA